MCTFFKGCGYPDSVVVTGGTVLHTSQRSKEEIIPFTSTYHPQNQAVKNTILTNFKQLQEDPETGRIFFKTTTCLLQTRQNPPGSCNTCPYIQNTINISGPKHLRDVKNNYEDASKPVSKHFNLPVHSFSNMTACGLCLRQGNTDSRKNLQQKFIFKIGTLTPHGIFPLIYFCYLRCYDPTNNRAS